MDAGSPGVLCRLTSSLLGFGGGAGGAFESMCWDMRWPTKGDASLGGNGDAMNLIYKVFGGEFHAKTLQKG